MRNCFGPVATGASAVFWMVGDTVRLRAGRLNQELGIQMAIGEAKQFQSHMKSNAMSALKEPGKEQKKEKATARNRELYRIFDLDAWQGGNRAESFLFPNYEDDSATPKINRVLLLDRRDWVPYHQGQAVKFNVMDRDNQGVRTLVIKRGNKVVERVRLTGKGIVERTFKSCGDYTAHCEMKDHSMSSVCEFAVCDLDFQIPAKPVPRGQPREIQLSSTT